MNSYYHVKSLTNFNFNSDLSGNVMVKVRDGTEISVPGEALLSFVAEWVRGQRISKLENMDHAELLGTDEPVDEKIGYAINHHEEWKH